jgi:hypothetical protein
MIYEHGQCENHEGLSDMCLECSAKSPFIAPALRQSDPFELIVPTAIYSLICSKRPLSPLNSAEVFMLLTATYNHVARVLGHPELRIFGYKTKSGVDVYSTQWHERIFPFRAAASELWEIHAEEFSQALKALDDNGTKPYRSLEWIRLLEKRILEAQAIMDEVNGDLTHSDLTFEKRFEELQRDYLTNELFPWTVERSACDALEEKRKNVDRWNMLRTNQLSTFLQSIQEEQEEETETVEKEEAETSKTEEKQVDRPLGYPSVVDIAWDTKDQTGHLPVTQYCGSSDIGGEVPLTTTTTVEEEEQQQIKQELSQVEEISNDVPPVVYEPIKSGSYSEAKGKCDCIHPQPVLPKEEEGEHRGYEYDEESGIAFV